jgi:acyl-homoserine-lactone acylase
MRALGLLRGLAALAALSAATAPAADADVLNAKIQRTQYGVPHVTAPNIKALAAGYAYAFAEDNICSIASEYVTVSAERSRYFGPDARWRFSGNGSVYRNLDADFYFEWVKEQGIVEDLLRQPPPLGPKPGIRKGVAGYVRGYNAYLRETGVDNISDPSCRGADWVRPIRRIDAYRRFFQLGILASSGAVINGIVNAAPVAPAAAEAEQAEQERKLEEPSELEALQPDVGSNAYGFGAEATKNGRGLVLGNPHFPWDGSERLYQTHLRIPGKLDVAGASLMGVPLVLIGHTRGLAWSHTVATAWRFTPFKLTLGSSPYTYVVDGQEKEMTATEVTVPVKTDEGLEERTHTIYSTEYGPMVDDLVGIPLPWGAGSGFAIRDVNATNFRYLNHFLDNNRAQTVEQYDRIQRRYQGIPWVNSVAADSTGKAYYTMQGAIPNVTDEQAAACNAGGPAMKVLGLPVLDGSRSACNWADDPDAVAPGTFAPDDVPTTTRDDYVHNGNDSHWLTNPEDPLTGYDRIIGIENAERTARTRIGLVQVEERLAGTDGLAGTGFNRKLLQRVTLGNRQYLGELWRDDLVALCDAAPAGQLLGSDGPVDVSGACDPLRDWDLRDNLGSAGAILFRRFASNVLARFRCVPTGLQGATCPGAETLYTTPYSNADPVHTPAGLNTANPVVGAALADAVTDLQGAGIPLEAGLQGHQYETRGGEQIPIHGGPGGLGVFNAINVSWNPDAGYPDVGHGSSFIMASEFRDGKCPVRTGTFVTYGQTENQSSPHANDYTKAFSAKRWNREPFCGGEVERATLETERISIGGRSR